jgi:hypothetical protein
LNLLTDEEVEKRVYTSNRFRKELSFSERQEELFGKLKENLVVLLGCTNSDKNLFINGLIA